MLGAKTGKGWVLPLIVVVDIYIIWILTSIVGLAITPIEGKLMQIFPGTTELESQWILIGPNIAAIPFIFIGGAMATKFNTIKLINWTCIFYLISGALFLIANSMIFIIILCFCCGFAAGVLSPVSVVLITRIFDGKYKSKQLGFTSATLNVFLALAVILTGYLADINWRLPFLMYLLPVVPLILSKPLSKYLPEPVDEAKKAAVDPSKPKVKYSFRKQCNVPALIRYCIFYLLISLAVSAISQYLPFLFKSSKTAGNLTSVLYVGIMASGYILNWCLKILKNYAFGTMLAMITIGLLIMIFFHGTAVIVGAGIFLLSFAYGIGQPYCYDLCSEIATPIASSLSMAWLISMDSMANVFCPYITEGVCKIFSVKPLEHPLFPFEIWMWICLAATILVFIRRFSTEIKALIHRHDHKRIADLHTVPTAVHAAVKAQIAREAIKAQPSLAVAGVADTESNTTLRNIDAQIDAVEKEEIEKMKNDNVEPNDLN